MEKKEPELYTVGELAQKSGVTIRTLQYYDKCKLLIPEHSEGGRRLYNRHDVMLLQQILFLKSFGFSLEEIRDRLLPTESPKELEMLLTNQKEALTQQIENLQKTIGLMEKVIQEIHTGKEIGTDKFVALMWLMGHDKPFSFVFRYLENRDVSLLLNQMQEGDQMQEMNHLSESLFTELLELSRSGADPAGEEGQKFAERWWNMTSTVTRGDPSLLKSLMSVGADVDNWPKEAQEFQHAIKTFLGTAMDVYFKTHNIQVEEEFIHE